MSTQPFDTAPPTVTPARRQRSVVWTVVEKEILENLYSFKFYLIVGLILTLMLASVIIMYRDYDLRLAAYETQRAEQGAAAAATATVPPNPLAILVKGLDDTLSAAYDVSMPNGGVQRNSTQQKTNPLFNIIATPDLLYIIRIILSLAALLITYDAICGEKERGTLRLMLSNQMGRNSLLLGKWIGAFLSLVVPLLIASLCVALVLMLKPRVTFNSQELWRIAGGGGLALLYIAVFLSLGLFISALSQTSAASMAASLLVWTFLVFLVPQLSPVIAEQFVDVPPSETVDERIALERIQNIHRANAAVSLLAADRSREMTQIYIDYEGKSAETIYRIEEDYLARQNRAVGLSKNIARLSPAACLTFAATDVTGTGLDELERLRTSILAFKRDYTETLFANRLLPQNQLRQYPKFSFRHLVGESGVRAAGVDLLLLIFYFALCTIGTQFALYRYDIR